MPKKKSIKKVLIIGSGPIVIRQGAEFDYAGIQACRVLREEGVKTILVNSNPATIMTDPRTADVTYLEPLTCEALTRIIEQEKPDGLLAGFGGQAGLDLADQLEAEGVLKANKIKLLGVSGESLRRARDRQAFRELMDRIGEPIPGSIITSSVVDCYRFTEKEGYPVVIRPAYVAGGTSIGIAENQEKLEEYFYKGMEVSTTGRILLEKSVAGWKEIIFEGVRDGKDNCVIAGCIETIDPVGIHTKDSLAVLPAQTLTGEEYEKLHDTAVKIIRSMEVEGGCSVHFALNPENGEYFVLEVNPGVSRSSALTARATGYPLARIGARIALGYRLGELTNRETEHAADREPVMDHVAVKFPCWPFGKFAISSRRLDTQMKATGEVVAMDSCFTGALLKAVSSEELGSDGLCLDSVSALTVDALIKKLYECDDERIFCIAEILRRELMDVDKLHEVTKIDRWFLEQIGEIIHMENELKQAPLTRELLLRAERCGLADESVMALSGQPRTVLQDLRIYGGIYPGYRTIGGSGSKADVSAPYYYASYDETPAGSPASDKKVLIIGPGPVRIGQGGEFDSCCIQGLKAFRQLGYDPVIINNNPEAVNTDSSASGRVYFEPLYIDDILNVVRQERPAGVILQFGGHTSMNLAEALRSRSIPVLGTPYESIGLAADREQFAALLKTMGIAAPERITASSEDDAFFAVEKLGYPLVVRSSGYEKGSMQVVYSDRELMKFIRESPGSLEAHPLLIDEYVRGREIEVDAVADGENLLIPGIVEHVERAGVHSGDSIALCPPVSLPEEVQQILVASTERIARALKVVGFINIQYAWDGSTVYVIDINLRASRSVPMLSKLTGIPMVELAAAAIAGTPLTDSEYGTGLQKGSGLRAAKIPVFSGAALTDMDMALGHEMKSTGEVAGFDTDPDRALYKGFLAEGSRIPVGGNIFLTLRTTEQNDDTADVLAGYVLAGFRIFATDDTIGFVREHGIDVKPIDYDAARKRIIEQKPGDPDEISIVISVPETAGREGSMSFPVRVAAAERKIPAFSCLDTARAFLQAVRLKQKDTDLEYRPLPVK